MKVFVSVRGEEQVFDVEIAEGGLRTVTRPDGTKFTADVRAVPGGLHALVGGRSLDVAVGTGADGAQFAFGPTRAEVKVETERDRARAARSGAGASGNDVRAPMPGRIVAVHVKEGDEVEAGAPLVVVEAMKMENEIRAPRSGRIARVAVTPGASVEGKAILVTFA